MEISAYAANYLVFVREIVCLACNIGCFKQPMGSFDPLCQGTENCYPKCSDRI